VEGKPQKVQEVLTALKIIIGDKQQIVQVHNHRKIELSKKLTQRKGRRQRKRRPKPGHKRIDNFDEEGRTLIPAKRQGLSLKLFTLNMKTKKFSKMRMNWHMKVPIFQIEAK